MTSSQNPSRRGLLRSALRLSGLGASAALASSLVAPAVHAAERRKLAMVTSWAKGSPGPGTTADRIAQRITTMTDGRLEVQVYGAGELTSPFGVMDAVGSNAAQLGHTASFFSAGKFAAAAAFTTLPFGLDVAGHQAWIARGEGQGLWDALYAPAGVKPFLAGNSDFTMGGWFKAPLGSLADLKGLRLRVAGLGGQIYEALGAVPTLLPPGEIFGALKSGAIDGVEFLGPFSDRALGFAKAAQHYYWPGFNKPNGSAEGLINKALFDSLSAADQAIVTAAFEVENYHGLAEASWFNGQSLKALRAEGVAIQPLPADIMQAAKAAWRDVLADWRVKHPEVEPVLSSHEAALVAQQDWASLSLQAYGKIA